MYYDSNSEGRKMREDIEITTTRYGKYFEVDKEVQNGIEGREVSYTLYLNKDNKRISLDDTNEKIYTFIPAGHSLLRCHTADLKYDVSLANFVVYTTDLKRWDTDYAHLTQEEIMCVQRFINAGYKIDTSQNIASGYYNPQEDQLSIDEILSV